MPISIDGSDRVWFRFRMPVRPRRQLMTPLFGLLLDPTLSAL